jgi:hypothetical protein
MSKSNISNGTTGADQPFVNVTYVLDITGSMGSQIEAVKSALRSNIQSFMENPEFAGLLSFSVLPYTESESKSYASFHTFNTGSEAQTFISQLRLSRPPGAAERNAHGADGPENVKAALSVLRRSLSDVPMIVFFITDAGWHHLDRSCGSYTTTQQAEFKFLTENDPNLPNHDMWTIWNSIPKDSLFFNPVLFTRGNTNHSYAQMTQSANGIMAVSAGASVSQISNLMTDVVKSIVSLLDESDDAALPKSLPGFSVYDCSGVKLQTCETDPVLGQAVCLTAPEAVSSFLNTQITQCVKVINGKGWRKRAISLNAKALHLQTRLYGMLLHYFLGTTDGDAVAAEIAAVIEQTREEMPDDQKGHFSVTMAKVAAIKESLQSTGVPEGFSDNVSLMTVKEVAEETTVEDIHEDFVDVVCSTLLGYMLNIQFPLDAAGNVDFMSAWDARVNNMGITMMSISTFLALLDTQEEVTDPSSGENFNAMTTVSGPPGSLQNAMYRLASMMQVGNFAACYGVKADVTKGFIPNLAPGVLCGTFKWLVHQSMTESIYNRSRNVLHTFMALDKTPAKALLGQLKDG